jgi:hypothetical protein
MRFHVFTIEVRDPGPGQDALNAFCAQHRLADVEKRFVDQGLNSYWTFCVATLDGEDSSRPAAERKRIDYREVLNEADPRPEEAPDPRRVLPRSRSAAPGDHEPRRSGFRTDTGADELRLPARASGVHKAIAQVQANLRRFPWFGKVDVDGYFPSIDHARLKQLLARRFKGDGFLALLGRIIDSCPAAPGRGLPIGSLTSQHFANHYLDGADRFPARPSARLRPCPLHGRHHLVGRRPRETCGRCLPRLRVWLANEHGCA